MVNKDASIMALALTKCMKPSDDPEEVWENYEWFYAQAHFAVNGESVWTSKQKRTKYWRGLRDAASENDAGKARELWNEINSEQQMDLWSEYSSAVRSTIKELLKVTEGQNGVSAQTK